MNLLPGVPAAPGIAIGTAFVVGSGESQIRKLHLAEGQLDKEVARLDGAVQETRQEIEVVKQRVGREVGVREAEIFNAYLHILQDPLLIQASVELIRSERVNAEYAVHQLAENLIQQFQRAEDEYLRERVVDVKDVAARLLKNLTGGEAKVMLAELDQDMIVVAKDLTPSQTASMRRERVVGFATDVGGKTSHVAIMARTLEIPAVVGLKTITSVVQNGDTLIVEGSSGQVLINPDPALVAKYRQAQQRYQQAARKLSKLKGVTAVTRDGYRLNVAANIELPEDVRQARKYGAEGIGLFRTEFLYLNRRDLPDEEEQFEAYRLVARQSLPYATVVRTLDLGGDKFLSRLGTSSELNPFLGLRAIRLCLAHVDVFKVQLRAILRASHFGKIKLMFPLISSVEEFREARAVLRQAQAELAEANLPFDKNMEIGMMIELPSAALLADVLAKEADFFSIGSNDLIQYTLAVDRVNERVAYLYNPLQPAILRLIKQVIEAAHQQRIWVGLCGEMAADPMLTPLLVGMGLDEFSMGPAFIPQVKKTIREIYFSQSRDLAAKVLACGTSDEVEEILRTESRLEVFQDESNSEK